MRYRTIYGTNKHCGKSNYCPSPALQNLALIWKNNGKLVSCKFGHILCDLKSFLEISHKEPAFCGRFSLFLVMRKLERERGFFRYLGDRYRPLLANATVITMIPTGLLLQLEAKTFSHTFIGKYFRARLLIKH